MIESIQFKNFKALRDATLPLSQFTLIVGPNGSGKSTVLQALDALAQPNRFRFDQLVTAGSGAKEVTVDVRCNPEGNPDSVGVVFEPAKTARLRATHQGQEVKVSPAWFEAMKPRFAEARVFALEPSKMKQPVDSREVRELQGSGSNLAGALTYLRDRDEDQYNHLRAELQRWLPEFDGVAFSTDQNGRRVLSMRQRTSQQQISCSELSEGTLLALAMLTIAHQPVTPSIIGLEEPDHGLHPRLLRDVRDALYRLAHPAGAQLKREPVQVIATTHNPYFLDLFREHPEEVVIAEKAGLEATLSRLSARSDLDEILADAPLSEVWYSGVLGGVPVGT